MIHLKDIEDAKFIAIVVKSVDLLPVGSALYTHIIRLHKKVSFVCLDEVDKKFSFLPWYDKLRDTTPVSADLVVTLQVDDFNLYEMFKTHNIKINQKMATALYASLLVEYDGFISGDVDGTVFANASELMACGAEYKVCNEFIVKRVTLARLRLKSLMLKNMLLVDDAKEAVFYLFDDDLKSSGATLKDVYLIMKEALGLEYVEKISLIKNNKSKEIWFEKKKR